MITDFVLGLVGAFFSTVNSIFPSLTVPSWFTTDNFGTTLAGSVGTLIAPLNAVVPLDPFLTVLHDGLELLPVVLAYLAFEWIWRHLPTIAGFGA